jgi:hypothetical protein
LLPFIPALVAVLAMRAISLPAPFHIADAASELPRRRLSGAFRVAANLIGVLFSFCELSPVAGEVRSGRH